MLKRSDNPSRKNFLLSEETCRLLDRLVERLTKNEGEQRSKTEVVQRAIRRYAQQVGVK